MKASDCLTKLAQKYGVEFEFNEEGVCSLSFDDDDINITKKDDFVLVSADLGDVVESLDLMREMLSSNGCREDYDGSVVCIDETFNLFVLYRTFERDLEYDVFEGQLVAFVKKMRALKNTLRDQDFSAVSPQVSSNSMSEDISLMINAIRV